MSCPFSSHVRANEAVGGIDTSLSGSEQEVTALEDVQAAYSDLSINRTTDETPAETATGELPPEALPTSELQGEASTATDETAINPFHIPYEPYEPCDSKYLSELLNIMAYGHRLQHQGLPRFQVHTKYGCCQQW